MSKVLHWDEYVEKAREAVAEGAVLLRNEGSVLPLKPGCRVALFGRMQNHYYKSGTGSGGLVNVDRVIGIKEGLLESGEVTLNADLLSFYENWEKENPFVEGFGWGTEPWSQKEAVLPAELYAQSATDSDVAVVIIARTAGEDRDNVAQTGAYLLTEEENLMLDNVRKHFNKMVVLLNVGNIIDFSFMDTYEPDGVMLTWQGGMVGGLGIADLVLGKRNPSGKMSDTVAYSLKDYPTDENFGTGDEDIYAEDIYVGYRYFETFAKERVRFPFGYGLSYTTFDIKIDDVCAEEEKVVLKGLVTNTGTYKGKEAVLVYVNAPQGVLGRPLRQLAGFTKTGELAPGESEQIIVEAELCNIAAYDDSGATGFAHAEVLEAGEYIWYAGTAVSDAVEVGRTSISETKVCKQYSDVCMPRKAFERMKPVLAADGKYCIAKESVPTNHITQQVRMANDPGNRAGVSMKDIPAFYEDAEKKYTLEEVEKGIVTMDELVEDLSLDELCCLVRGEGMGSPKVTPGTASAFAGISEGLVARKIPAVCCSDGPSGMRLDCGRKAFSLPNGTLLACTFNEGLNEELFELLGYEMRSNQVDVILGPGMNIHRHPLNGRNFEYFSEDPLLTGKMAAAQMRGLHKANVTGAMKHFCANNRETNRRGMNSVVSARALREIYLRGYKIVVDEAGGDCMMTTYGALNGVWTAGNHELVTTVLREEWGFEGVVMTDWWAEINVEGGTPNGTDFATMVQAQNDLYMVCPDGSKNLSGDNLSEKLLSGELTVNSLRRTAKNILSFAMKTPAYLRVTGREPVVEVAGGPKQDIEDLSAVEYYELKDGFTLDLSGENTGKDQSFVLALNSTPGSLYEVEFVAKSDLGVLAQLPVTIFYQGFPLHSMVFQGSEGKETSIRKTFGFRNRYGVYRLHFAQNGLQMVKIVFHYKGQSEEQLFS